MPMPAIRSTAQSAMIMVKYLKKELNFSKVSKYTQHEIPISRYVIRYWKCIRAQ
jgi:hypothetical protein